jgi:hypothetical protein
MDIPDGPTRPLLNVHPLAEERAMTKLTPAEEWADLLRKHSYLSVMDIDTLEKGFRKVQRNAAQYWLELAADIAASNGAVGTEEEIRELIPKDPAPADEAAREMEREHEIQRRVVASEGSL